MDTSDSILCVFLQLLENIILCLCMLTMFLNVMVTCSDMCISMRGIPVRGMVHLVQGVYVKSFPIVFLLIGFVCLV